MRLFLKILAVFLLVNLSIGAIYGSWVFISAPDGSKFNMTVDYLKNTPFKNYLIPGIILFIMNGLLPLSIVFILIMKKKIFPRLLIFQGLILIGWLTVEILFNKAFFMPLFHYPLYATAITLILIGCIFINPKR